MESSGFCSPRSDAFPAGLRVLVVDDDPTWLKILEKMLKKCSYEVTTCGLAREALDLLRERKDGFDIVISDVNMPDMDGFKLLERVGLELDLPVIMMSVDGETSRVMKGVQHGACDYLLKPIRMKELKNIWQHVFRKRIHEVKETDSDGLEEIQMMSGSQSEYGNDYYSFTMGDMCSGKKKRKDAESKHDDREYSDTSSIKKPRVVWTVDLHQKFVRAVNLIGFDKVGPKKILDLMGVPWLTRENVASHLQKYRLYLSRLQKDGEQKDTSFIGAGQVDVPPRDPAENVFLQSPMIAPQTKISGNCGTSGNKSPRQNINVKIHNGGIKELASGAEPPKALKGDDSDSKKSSNQCLSSSYSFQMPSSDVMLADSVPSQYLWTAEYPQLQCKPESKSHMHLEKKFNHLSPKKVKIQQNEQVNTMPESSYFSLRLDNRKEYNLADVEVQGIREVPQAQREVNLFSMQSESQLINSQQFGRTPGLTWTIKNGCSAAGHMLLEDLEFAQRNIGLSSGSVLSSEDKESLNNVLQGVHQSPINIGIHNGESFDCADLELHEADTPLYDSLKFDYEYPFDSMEYPVLDQSLFIV